MIYNSAFSLQECVPKFDDVVVRSSYLKKGLVISFHSKLRDVIIYPCLRYLLLATKPSYNLMADWRHTVEDVFTQIELI